MAAGAELRERFSVDGARSATDERVAGIRGRAAGGATVAEKARIVIGADGMHSFVARTVQAPAYDARPGAHLRLLLLLERRRRDGAELYPRAGRMLIVAPDATTGWRS